MSLVVCVDLVKRFGGKRALDGLNLIIEPGGPVALVGENGAGKTTLLSLWCGFLHPSRGSVRLFGERPGSSALRGRLSAMPQDAALHPQTSIGHQLRHFARLQGMSRREAQADTLRVLEQVQLSEAEKLRPGALSHGMRKRATLAQALLGSPELILLDEPTAGIDPPNVRIIRDIVRAGSAEATFVVSSHNLDELEKLCTTVVSLSRGRLVEQGTVSELSTESYLTLLAPEVPVEAFMEQATKLSGHSGLEYRGSGEFRLHCASGSDVDRQLLGLLHEHGWRYRSLAVGQSLEDRLYG